MSKQFPSPPAGPRTPQPPRNPAPIPSRPTPPPKPADPKRVLADPSFRLAVAFIVVGVIGLVAHYWMPYLLIAALPTKRWREAAVTR
jgi:hypothetical protein